MPKLLIIAYPFPPIPYSGTYRIIRMCKGLTRLGVEVHVLTIRIDMRIPNDFDLLSRVPKSVKVHRSKIIDPWLRYRQWRKKRDELNLHGYVDKLVSAFMRLVTIPDHQIFWMPSVIQRGRNIIRKYNISNIMVTSPPVSTLLGGILLKKMTGARLLADLRDPIVGNIAQVNLINPTDIFSKIEKNVLMRLEKVIVNSADIVIANTETHCKEMKTKYGVDKFHTVRNAFDEDDYKGISQEKYAEFTISHIGSMYGLRKADVLFQAISRLESEFDPEPLNLQMLFVGSNAPRLKQQVCDYGVEKYVEIKGMVSHKKAIEIMVRSHLLLLIKATGEGSYGQIPAKFFEYLGTKNKILCLGPKESEVAGIIRRLCAGYVIENNVDETFKVLKLEYEKYLKGNHEVSKNIDISEYSCYGMGDQIAHLIS